jgi:GNAT superfamily N-acetyltransferase
MEVRIRLAAPIDIEACGRIMYEAFKSINERHGFENTDFPTAEVGAMAAGFWIRNPSCWGVVAETEGRVIGSCFADERSSIRGVGPVTVAPTVQGQGVGRKLMEALLEQCRGSRRVRLAQHTFNTSSLALYASLGFEVKEPLVLMHGQLSSKPLGDVEIRPMRSEDLDACRALCEKVHGFERINEVRNGLQFFAPFVALRADRIVAYASAPAVWSANHGVAEVEADMRALLLGICASMTDPLFFLLPIRQTSFFRWCLDQGMRVVKPMTLMAMGEYQEPAGCYFPSAVF